MLANHLCAFSNQEGGGFLVYGVNDDATMFSVSKEQADEIIRKLGNIARNNLMQPLILDPTGKRFMILLLKITDTKA